MKPFNKNNLNTPWVAYTIATCSAVVLFSILTHLDVIGRALHGMGAFLYPIVLAAIIAYILNPLVDFYKKSLFENVPSERLRGNLSVFCAILSFLLVALILLVSLIPQVISGIVQFVGNFDSYASSMQRLLGRLNDYALEMNLDISGLINSSGSLLDTLSSLLPRSLNNIVNTSINLTKSIFEAVVSFILAVYFLSAKDNLKAGFKFLLESVLSPSVYPGTIDFLKNCHNIMLRYIIFDALDGIIIGVSNGLFMAAAGMPYVVLGSDPSARKPLVRPLVPSLYPDPADHRRLHFKAQAVRRLPRRSRRLGPGIHHLLRKTLRHPRRHHLDPSGCHCELHLPEPHRQQAPEASREQ